MEPVESEEVCSKLRCSDIAAETLETLPRMDDMNNQMQMQIRSIVSAPVLHPTIGPPPISANDLGAKLITIVDLQSEVAQLATNLANLVNGGHYHPGSMDPFMLAQGILDQVDNDGKIILLTRKRDALKANLLEMKLQKSQEAPSRSADTIPQQTLQFHSNSEDTISRQTRSDDINFERTLQKLQEAPSRSADTIPQQSYSNIPPLDEDHALLDIPSAWILPHKRAHEDKRNVTVQYVFTWAVRLCATLKMAFSMHQIGLKFRASHGYDRKSWFRRSGKGHKFLYVEDIWKAACVFPRQHKPSSDSKLSIVRTPAVAAQTLPLDGSEENQENRGNKVRTPDGQ